ncbi:MAG: hypothetical protein ACOWWM_18945 [Desulfobacterales bacterium]
MATRTMTSGRYSRESPLRRWWNSRNFIQQRMIRFCVSLLVMIVCFPLYYAGLFGTVDGPLNPARIGARLAAMGVTHGHALGIFLTLMIVSVSWNWIFNAASMAAGHRLTCSKNLAGGRICGEPTRRVKEFRKVDGKQVTRYRCSKGHVAAAAHFHPVRKGTVSHMVWVLSVFFCVVVFFMS